MTKVLTLRERITRFMPVFMGVVIMACLSLGAVVSLAGDAFFSDVLLHKRAIYSWLGCMALGFLVVQTNVFILFGRRGWAAVMAAYFVICLVLMLLSFAPDDSKVLMSLSVLWPLLGLFLLNSRRHREMREYSAWLRSQRLQGSARKKVGER